MMGRGVWRRLLALVQARRLDRELDAEILAHLELAERDGLAAGLSPEEARAAARRQFGAVSPMREVHRDRRSVRWIETLMRDVRYGMGSLVRDPGFAIVAIGVLALGIGANAAMFSLVDAVLFKPLPFPRPDRLVRVWEAPTPGTVNEANSFNFVEWQRRSRSFDGLAAEARITVTALIGGEATRVRGKVVSADYFEVLGVKPFLGRTFTSDEDRAGSAPVIVLSHATWQTRFGGDPNILTRLVSLDGEPHRIVGVLPAGVFDRDIARAGEEPAGFWKPLVSTPEEVASGEHWLKVIGRLRPDVSLAQAQAEMNAVRASLTDIPAKAKTTWGVTVEPFDQRLVGDSLRQSIYLAFGAVVLVLLITCANVANLLLSKGVTREKELVVRAALGASRGRLIAQLLTESLVLCLIGAAASIAVAALLIHVAVPLLPATVPFTADVRLDLRVLGFVLIVALGAVLLVGLLPSLRASTGALAASLNQVTRGSSRFHGGVRRAIVVGEVAVSLILICGALLLFQSLWKLQHVDAGVRIDRVMGVSTELAAAVYQTPESAARLYPMLVERLQAVPGVERAGVSSDLPLEGTGGEFLRVPGFGDREQILVRYKRVDPGYFGALDIPVLAGRGITDRDRPGAPFVVVINQELARHLADRFHLTNPIGQTVNLATPNYERGSGRADFQIVGVIRSERIRRDLRTPIEDVAYVSIAQIPRRDIEIVLRATREPGVILPSLREAVRQLDPRLALADVRTMAEIKQHTMSGTTEPTWVIGMFAAVAVLLAALGLYGVLAHAVSQRRREIGIRIALGASGRDVLGQIVRHALSMVLIGLAIGFAGAAVLTRVTASLLFQVSALDPIAFGGAGLLMLLIGLLAALIPASRAARVDPMTALRAEG
jgi:predicted permease